VLHPTDYEILMATAASTAELIVSPDPTQAGAQTIWGVRLVVSSQITSGVALVANLAIAAKAFIRQAPTLTLDPFTLSANNLVRFIAEERLVIGVGLPAAVCKTTFNGTT
jgi:HK97 family phage major capsid protein